MKHLFIFLSALLLSSCSSVGYYWQAMNGHAELLNRQQPVTEVLQDKTTRPEVKDRLRLAQSIRQFASHELNLPDNNSYSQYADLKQPFALWNVVATPQYSIKPKQWCFMFVGCLSYRGYYDKQQAEDFAEILRQQGYDVMVSGARAYSTLGWFDDPLLNTMLYKSDARLAGIIFHELAHQKIYKKTSSAFNEAFAMSVEIEGVLRWLSKNNDSKAIRQYQYDIKQQMQFNHLLRAAREKLKKAYNASPSDQAKRQAKQQIFAELKKEYQVLKQQWGGDDSYDLWMTQELNNAHLALVGTYYDNVPFFRRMIQENKGNFARFYQLVEDLSVEEMNQFRLSTKVAVNH